MTLIELMVSMSVASILLTLSAPPLREIVQENRMVAQANDFVADLMRARSEAQKRRVPVVACRSAQGQSCDSGAGGWEDGWILYLDLDGDQVRDAGETVLLRSAGLEGSATLRGDANFSSRVSYQGSGLSLGNGGSASGSFRICDGRGAAHGRDILVSPVGRPAVSADSGTATCT